MEEKEATITVCNICEYLGECVKNGAVIDAAKPDSDSPRYIPGLGSNCKRMERTLRTYEAGYEEGLNDALGALKKLVSSPSEGGFSIEAIITMFDNWSLAYIAKRYTAKEIIDKIKTYEEETLKIKRGDYVTWKIENTEDIGIMLHEQHNQYIVLCDDNPCPQYISKSIHITKLDKHIDLDGLFDGVKNHD